MKRYDINDYFDFNRINNVSSIFKYSQIGDLNKNLVSPAFMVASKMASLNKSFVATKAAYLTSPTGILNEYSDKYIQKLHKDLIPKALPNIQNFNTGVMSQKVIASFERVQKLTKIFERQLKGLTHISPVDVHNSIVPNGEIAVNLASEHWIMLLQDSKIDKELLNECKVAEKYDFDKIAQSFYLKNNHRNVFRKMDYLLSADYDSKEIKLVDGFHEQIKRVKKILSRDFNDSEAVISTVMTWIEYAVAAKFGVLEDKNGYKLGGKIKSLERKIEKIELKEITPLVVDYYNVFFYLSNLWNSKLQDFKKDKDKVGLGRHSIQHARVDPRRYTDEVMSKLICLLYALVKLPDLDEFEMSLQA